MGLASKQLRVLIVEDEWMIAEELAYTLRMSGMNVAGPVGNVPDALDLLEREQIDMAVLNLRLQGDDSFPVAERLQKAAIPFLFLSGNEVIPPPFSEHSRLAKPCDQAQLIEIIRQAVNRSAEG
jgi:DNA-binding response OmpR family regulator